MGGKTFLLWLLLLGTLGPKACCQHWSFGLSPGGKREADSLSETLNNFVEDLSRMDVPCGLYGCAKASPHARLCRLRTLLASITDNESERQRI